MRTNFSRFGKDNEQRVANKTGLCLYGDAQHSRAFAHRKQWQVPLPATLPLEGLVAHKHDSIGVRCSLEGSFGEDEATLLLHFLQNVQAILNTKLHFHSKFV